MICLLQRRVLRLNAGLEVLGLPDSEKRRELLYARMGVFVSNHSQVLLVLWDGKASSATGGIAGVVQYHLTAVMPGFLVAEDSPNLLADNENDPAFHIVVSRNRPDGEPRQGMLPLQTAWVTTHYRRASGDRMPFDHVLPVHSSSD